MQHLILAVAKEGECVMADLTESQIARLREWAARKMGFEDVINPRTGTVTGYKTPHGFLWRVANSGEQNVWHPETSLDQAVIVANKMAADGPMTAWKLYCHRGRGYLGSVTVPGQREVPIWSEKEPATALLLAAAKADGFEVGDG